MKNTALAIPVAVAFMCSEVYSDDTLNASAVENGENSVSGNFGNGVPTDERMASDTAVYRYPLPSYVPNTDYDDVMSYSIVVRINGRHNHSEMSDVLSAKTFPGVYVVCLDTDYDDCCEDELTTGLTDSLGYHILAWSDVTVDRKVVSGGNIIAVSDDDSDEFFRYPVADLKFRYDTEAEIVYDDLYLNSLSNIQNLMGKHDFNKILGVVSSVNFAERNPDDDRVYRSIMYSFDDADLGGRDIYRMNNSELALKVNSVYSRISGKVNEHEMDDIVSLIISNIDGSDR